MKCIKRVRIKNALGLHTRPAASIVQMLQGCRCSVSFKYRKEEINAKSILSILMLAAKRNTLLTIITEGEDAELTMKKLTEAFDNKFGELA